MNTDGFYIAILKTSLVNCGILDIGASDKIKISIRFWNPESRRMHKQSKFFKEQSSPTCCLNSNRYLLYLNCMHWQLKNEATIWQDHTLHFIIYHWQMQQVLYVLYLYTNCYLILFSWGWVGHFGGYNIWGKSCLSNKKSMLIQFLPYSHTCTGDSKT